MIGNSTFNPMDSNTCFTKITSFANSDMATYSTSVDDRVMIFPALDLQDIGSPHRYKINP